MKSGRVDHPRAWAWRIDGGLCCWAEPYRDVLTKGAMPSPEAKVVVVRLVPEREYRDLRRKGKP